MLPTSFFENDTLSCARALIGKRLVWGRCAGIVVETEAYLTKNDEACHAFLRPSTRQFIERNKPGAAYIYLNYGVHWMLNVLVKGAEPTGLILIRAIEPTHGLTLMRRRRGVEEVRKLCSGPGKLAQALAITFGHHELDLCADPRRCFAETDAPAPEVLADGRIGISRAAHFPWRFTMAGSAFLSRPFRPVGLTATPRRRP